MSWPGATGGRGGRATGVLVLGCLAGAGGPAGLTADGRDLCRARAGGGLPGGRTTRPAARAPWAAAARAGGGTAHDGGPGRHGTAGVRGEDGLDRPCRRAGEGRDQGESHTGASRRHPEPTAEEQPGSGQQADAEDDPAQPGVPVRGPGQDDEGPARGDQRGPGEQRKSPPLGAARPDEPPTDADQRPDRRRQGHRVVLVEDAVHEGERQPGDDERGAPQEQRRPADVGARSAAHDPQARESEDQRGRDEPGDVPAEVTGEHAPQADVRGEHPTAGPTGRAAHRGRTGNGAARAGSGGGRGLRSTEDPAEAVVAEGEVEEGVGRRPADVRPVRRRGELDDRDPPAGRDDHRGDGEQTVPDPPADRDGRGQQVDRGDARDDEHGLQLLGEEPEADQHPREHHPPGAAVLDRAQGHVDREGQQQHEQRVGVVEAEHQRRHRRQRQDRAGEQARLGAEVAAHRGVHHADRRHAHQRLRHQDRPGAQAEDPHRDAPSPTARPAACRR